MDQFVVDHTATLFAATRHVFDGARNLFTVKLLPLPDRSYRAPVTVDIDGRPGVFKLKITLVDRVPMAEAFDFYSAKQSILPERVVHVFEIVFRALISQAYESFQRKFFDFDMVQRSPKVSGTL